MRQARAGVAPFVDQSLHVAGVRGRASSPRLRRELELGLVELRDRSDVPAALHHDLLPLERGVEIRDDAHTPVPLLGEDQCLRRSPVLVSRAERTRRELVRGGWIECAARRTRALRTSRSDHGGATRLGLAAKLAAQLELLSFGANARSRSTGKTIVVACDEPSSNKVWR
jgi:hypothetical protein